MGQAASAEECDAHFIRQTFSSDATGLTQGIGATILHQGRCENVEEDGHDGCRRGQIGLHDDLRHEEVVAIFDGACAGDIEALVDQRMNQVLSCLRASRKVCLLVDVQGLHPLIGRSDMLFCDGNGDRRHVIAVEVLEVVIEEGENDIRLRGSKCLSQRSARGLGRLPLVGLGRLGEANGSY